MKDLQRVAMMSHSREGYGYFGLRSMTSVSLSPSAYGAACRSRLSPSDYVTYPFGQDRAVTSITTTSIIDTNVNQDSEVGLEDS